jgi:anti-sigma regulatory factor (Ser/Thr protein kinase)
LSHTLTVPRRVEALQEISQLIERFFSESKLGDGPRYPIELAVEEIFTNMVRHNASGRSDIRVDLAAADGEIVATVTDFDAPRFDPTTDAPPPGIERQLELRTPGGLGIHLVRKMMDRIEYSHRDRTATVVLRKRAT